MHQQFSRDIEEKVMTLGQQATQKPAQHPLKEAALRMLEKKFDINLISELTNLSPEEIKRLGKQGN